MTKFYWQFWVNMREMNVEVGIAYNRKDRLDLDQEV